MMNPNFKRFGWVLSAALGAVLLVSGFQAQTEKTGVVNIQKLVTGSNFGKASQVSIDAMSQSRKDLLAFANENPVMTTEQAQLLRELTLKAKRTSDEDLKLAQIRADLTANTKKLTDLANKPNPTPAEKDLINDFGGRLQNARVMLQNWAAEFQQEIQGFGESQYGLTMERVNAAVQEVAKAQGFTMIFDSRYATYGASEITDAALTAMNAKP